MQEVTEEKSSSLTNDHEGQKNDDNQPLKKKLKLENMNSTTLKDDDHDDIKVTFNEKLLATDLKSTFKNHWINEKPFNDDDNQIELFNHPFKHCIIKNFLENHEIINKLINEMAISIDWSRKQMDLYEFYQSTDLSCVNSKYLSEFFYTLKTNVMPWIEEVCNVKLKRVSASCSMYDCGDHLLVHDDLLNDRQIAFIFYLTPWRNVEIWNNEMGGCLELFDADSNCLPKFPISKKIPPRNNQFVFFKVGSKSFHQVGEVTTFDYPRLTINGWFHGEENKDNIPNPVIHSVASLKFEKSIKVCESYLDEYINEMYLEDEIKEAIQKHIEDNSEISLQDFLKSQQYDEILQEMQSYDNTKWSIKGPANVQCYEILRSDELKENGKVEKIFKLFHSDAMFKLLYELTDLDLFGNNAKNPTCHVEIQRWHHGSYTILGDGLSCDKNTLEVIFYLNASESCGIITYLSSDNSQNHDNNDEDSSDDDDSSDDNSDDTVLLTITPKSNNLSIVYRLKGTTKFTKYVSKKCKISGDHVYIFVASYRE